MSSLAPAPRPVPLAVQWQLFSARPAVFIGLVFLCGGGAFLVAFLSNPEGLWTPWVVIPTIHLGVGVGLTTVPIVRWRRAVAILKHGQVAAARLVAVQDRGGIGHDGEAMVNTAGPWVDYERSFAQTQMFWTTPRIEAAPAAPLVLKLMGWCVALIGLFGVAWAVVVVALLWLGPAAGERGAGENMLLTLALGAFAALFLGTTWFMRRVFNRMGHFAAGGMSPATVGIEPVARCRFVFKLPEGQEAAVIASVNLRWRLQSGRAEPQDIAIFLPDEPQRALLLGGLWPRLSVRDGQWVQHPRPGEN